MGKKTFAGIFVLTLPCALWMQGCANLPTLSSLTSFGRKPESGVERVDDLLTKVEQVQIEAAVSKERARDALSTLVQIAGNGFSGDPAAAHQGLAQRTAQSSEQAKKFAATIAPMKELATRVFDEWTASLEQFGGASMRMQSQARLEETRQRYESIVASAVAVQLAYDSFNRALGDHVLFLEHDFNAASVQALAPEVEQLGAQAVELDRRFVACMSAADAYVAAATLRGQAATEATDARPTAPLSAVAKSERAPAPQPRKKAITTKPPVYTGAAAQPTVAVNEQASAADADPSNAPGGKQ